jgi:ATP-dependent Lon protease
MLVDLIMWTFQALQKRKIKNNMSTQQQDTTQAEVFYVWGKSERAGDIVQEDTTKPDSKWMNFTDGTRCNRELVGEYLLKTSSEEDAKSLALSFNPAANINVNRSTKVEVKTTTAPKPEVKEEVNVMMEMLRKMSAKNQAEMPVKVNIPSKQVYDLLKDQMDITKKDLNEQIGLLVESQIDNLRDQLKEQIESYIKSYYNGTTATTIDA